MLFRKKKAVPVARPSPLRAVLGREVATRLATTPGVRRRPSDHAEIYARPDFLTPEQCAMLMASIDANRRRSTLMSENSDPEYRTSDSGDFDPRDPQVQAIDRAIADLLGIPVAFGETIQGQRYAPRQQFRAHHDYFHEGESYWDEVERSGGQRTWTAMIYLNDVQEGGATWFPQAGVRVLPQRGLLLAWNNMNLDGSPNEATLHEGMAVVRGTKYIITKWFRESRWIG